MPPGRKTGSDGARVRTLRARVTAAGGAEFDRVREAMGLTESDAVRLAVKAWVKRNGAM